MPHARMKKIATVAAATAAVGGVLLTVGPAASAAPAPAEWGPPVVQIPLNHAVSVAARDSGIPAALDSANITIPVPGWERVIDASANVLESATTEAAAYPNGCAEYEFYLPPSGTWLASAVSHTKCPW